MVIPVAKGGNVDIGWRRRVAMRSQRCRAASSLTVPLSRTRITWPGAYHRRCAITIVGSDYDVSHDAQASRGHLATGKSQCDRLLRTIQPASEV